MVDAWAPSPLLKGNLQKLVYTTHAEVVHQVHARRYQGRKRKSLRDFHRRAPRAPHASLISSAKIAQRFS